MTTHVSSRSTTVRVTGRTHDTLRRLSDALGISMQEAVARAADAYWRRYVIERSNEGYAELMADPEAWQEELEERALWGVTLADGLDEPE